MAATKVCNYRDTPGFSYRGPGDYSVMLDGQVYQFFTRVSNSNPRICLIIIFVFDSSASRACLSQSGNANKKLLNDIADRIKCENQYCID
jgi:hypothetical protein